MKTTWFLACIYVALDCLDRATGGPQTILASDMVWLWYAPAAAWAGVAIATIFVHPQTLSGD